MEIDRRTALALIAIGVAPGRAAMAQHQFHALAANPKEYKTQFFTDAEHRLIDCIAEMIIPADEHSPGAREARVASYIDLIAANSSEEVKWNWKSRLKAFDQLAIQRYGKPFLELGVQEQKVLMDAVSANQNPSTEAEHLFADLRQATIFGYYTSQIGLLKELGYKGNAVLSGFAGCTLRNAP